MITVERYSLPLEIWEEILSKLIYSPRALLSASKVCVQWCHLVARICEKFCSNKLDPLLLMQLTETEVIHRKCESHTENDCIKVKGEEWINKFWLYHETSLDTNILEKRLVLSVFDKKLINITTADPYLLISTFDKLERKTTIHAICSTSFTPEDVSDNVQNTSMLIDGIDQRKKIQVDGKVFQVCLLTLPTPVLLLSTSTYMKAAVMSNEKNVSEIEVIDTSPRIKGDSKTSAEGNYFLTKDEDYEEILNLYKASLPDLKYNTLNVTLTCKFRTVASPYSLNLSRGLIQTMETSGHIRVYKTREFATEDETSNQSEERDYEWLILVAESAMKKDLRYPNPTLFTKDAVFSSTIVSRALLEYWHMDRDRDFWLIGNISPDFKKKSSTMKHHPINLHKVVLGKAAKQEVTAVIFNRGLMLCGTEEGHILGYNVQKNMHSMEKEGFNVLRGLPWLNITGVASSPIGRLGTLFTPLGLLLAVGEDSGKCSLVHVQLKEGR